MTATAIAPAAREIDATPGRAGHGGTTPGRVAAACVALLVVYLGCSFALDLRGTLLADSGGKLATMRVMEQRGALDPDLGYWAAADDPAGDLVPLYYSARSGDGIVQASTLPMLYAAFPLYDVGGTRAALIVPMPGGVLSALAARALARRLGGDLTTGWVAFWAVGLATPVAIYAVSFWEHTLGLAAMLWAIVLALDLVERRGGAWRALGAGALFGVAEGWSLVRRCGDRLAMIVDFLAHRGIREGDFLDVGSNYGWFVARMGQQGFVARGLEVDPAAERLGRVVYGLERGQVSVGDAVELLANESSRVVSCFSVLHHFVMGMGRCSAEEFIARLDDATGEVLFLDTGQSHEQWFRNELPEWDPCYIEKWLRTNTTFAEVLALGVDGDDAPPYEGNYGRTLFACVR